MEITVAYENDALLARVSAVWKDGKALTDLSGEPAVRFTNQRLYAVLPETGGPGTGVYTALGALTVFLAAGLWAVSKPRKREDARP
ncbi:MAG: LPXTG cell wall anchor domain-containing protein [Christensenellales bacterium]